MQWQYQSYSVATVSTYIIQIQIQMGFDFGKRLCILISFNSLYCEEYIIFCSNNPFHFIFQTECI